jgi:hypothetical protein
VRKVSLERQVVRRMSDEAKRINAEIARATEKNGGKLLKPKQRGAVIRDSFKKKGKPPQVIVEEKARGRDREAMAIARGMFEFSDRQPFIDGGDQVALGNWGDIECGRDDDGAALMQVVLDALEPGQERKLELLWNVNPEHVGFVAALEKGMFR